MTRSYHQHCPIAVALDELGDRWVLLILRELILGRQRFTDLRRALPGIAPNLLSERLRTLEDAGLVARTVLEPPAARTVYMVTALGRESGPVLDALARYGAGRLGPGDDHRPWLTPIRAAQWFITAFHTPEPSEQPFHARVRVDGSPLDVVVVGRKISLSSGSDGAVDLEVDVTVEDLVAARRGEPLRLPAGPASERFARLFQFETLDTAAAEAVR